MEGGQSEACLCTCYSKTMSTIVTWKNRGCKVGASTKRMWVPEQQREVENCGSGDIPPECSASPTCLPITLRQAALQLITCFYVPCGSRSHEHPFYLHMELVFWYDFRLSPTVSWIEILSLLWNIKRGGASFNYGMGGWGVGKRWGHQVGFWWLCKPWEARRRIHTHPSEGCAIRTLPAGSPAPEVAPQSWI